MSAIHISHHHISCHMCQGIDCTEDAAQASPHVVTESVAAAVMAQAGWSSFAKPPRGAWSGISIRDPAAVANRSLVSHICASDLAGTTRLIGSRSRPTIRWAGQSAEGCFGSPRTCTSTQWPLGCPPSSTWTQGCSSSPSPPASRASAAGSSSPPRTQTSWTCCPGSGRSCSTPPPPEPAQPGRPRPRVRRSWCRPTGWTSQSAVSGGSTNRCWLLCPRAFAARCTAVSALKA